MSTKTEWERARVRAVNTLSAKLRSKTMQFLVLQNGAIECKFERSPHPFWISAELAANLGGTAGIEQAFLHDGVQLRMFPRSSSPQRPYRPIDWDYMTRNKSIMITYHDTRKWRFNPSCIVGNTRYWGYGYDTPNGFQFWNWEQLASG